MFGMSRLDGSTRRGWDHKDVGEGEGNGGLALFAAARGGPQRYRINRTPDCVDLGWMKLGRGEGDSGRASKPPFRLVQETPKFLDFGPAWIFWGVGLGVRKTVEARK